MSIALIGIGNAFRRDDGAGISVVRRLKKHLPDSTSRKYFECSGEGAGLIETWQGFTSVYLFDAVMARQATGRIYRLDGDADLVPTDFFKYSSHAFSLAEAVQMARVLDQLPPRLVIYGIEGEDYDHGEGLTPAVDDAVDQVVQRVLEEINAAESLAVNH